MSGDKKPLVALLASLLAAGAGLVLASTGAAQGSQARNAGNAFLQRVHIAYSNVPGVVISGQTSSLSFTYTLLLRHGVVVQEDFVGKEGPQVTKLVSEGATTYALAPRTACWQALSPADPEAFHNLGLHFPDQKPMQVKTPRRTQIGWSLPIVENGTRGVLAIDPKSLLVTSVLVGIGSSTVTEQVNALQSAPKLFASHPHCS